jgi:hypothetical protein
MLSDLLRTARLPLMFGVSMAAAAIMTTGLSGNDARGLKAN